MAETVVYSEAPSEKTTLIVFDKTGVSDVYPICGKVSIGRKGKQKKCDIELSSGIVSRFHGEITCLDSTYYYKDMDSTNGTYVNHVLLGKNSKQGKKTTVLKDGDVLSIDLIVDKKHHPERVLALFATGMGNEAWESVKLSDSIAEICIGRTVASGLKIENDRISERHASFFCANGEWAIIDHQSTNGVYLNGKRLSAPSYLKEFDVVRIVDTYFIFTGTHLLYSYGEILEEDVTAACAAEETVAREVKVLQPQLEKPEVMPPQVGKTVKRERVISGGQLEVHIVERSVVQRFKKMILLQDINLSVSNGEMVLILGGSGAGKTTFINAVMGYEKASGQILYRDTDIYEEYEKMKYEIGFVPQQDLLRGSDTVYDTLSNAAEMKLPRRIDYDEREQRISNVLEELGLSRERETLVSKLSGGQKKRLSIAVEFIANPSLFFLDEPDSGLDDIMGRGLMENLRSIADQGKIVMIITHSPERAADLFDKIIVLAKSSKDNCGHLAFFGSVKEAFRFFDVGSFREIVKKINRPDENGEGLSDYYIEKYEAYSKGENNE